MRNLVVLFTFFLVFFSSFVPSVFAGSGNSELKDRDELKDRYEIEQSLNSKEASFEQMRAVDLLHDYLKNGRKDTWITEMFQKALNTNPNFYAVERTLEILEETNDPEIEGIVREFCEKRKDMPQFIKERAIVTLHEIQLNQKSFEEYVENLKKEVSESTIEKYSQRMINLFDYNDVFTYFHNITNEEIKSEADHDRLSTLINAIGESENERLKSAILPDILKLAPESNRAVSVLKFFDPNLTYSTLLSIIGNGNIDPHSIRADAIESLFYNLPLERYDETIKKIKEIISDDEYFMAVFNDATKKWKEKNGTETEENNEESMPERIEEKVEDKKITKEAALSCIGGMTGASESHFRKMAENASDITERLESSSPVENQRENGVSDREARIHLVEAQRIENKLKNALERLEMDTDTYQVAVEPMHKKIIQLQNEINESSFFAEIGEVFGYNEFGTHESRRFEIRKKEFEIRKKEQEILGSAIDELRDAYDEATRFFNAKPSVRKKSFPSQITLSDRELLTQSREMLSELSKIQQKQNHN